MSARVFCGCASLVALGVALPGGAWAQEVEAPPPQVVAAPADATEEARALFEEGLALADQGDWERATHRFRSALDRREAAPVRYNLALSLSEMGRLTEAIEEIDRVTAAADADAGLREGALELRARLSARLGRLTVEVEGPQENLQVTVDGRPWASVGRPGLADPGIRIVRLMRQAVELDIEEADVPEGGEAALTLEVPEASADGIPPWVWGIVTHLSLAALGAVGATILALGP